MLHKILLQKFNIKIFIPQTHATFEEVKKMDTLKQGQNQILKVKRNGEGFQIDNTIFVFIIILMQEGLRNTITYDSNKPTTDCECVFLLRRINEASRTIEIRADFTPAIRPQSSSLSGDSHCYSALPTFNKDNKFFTPSFVLQEDKARIQENSSECFDNHQRKVKQFLEEKEELLVPKPSKANRFCLICKETYEDYLTHINYPSHNRLLKSSAFYNDVLELCQLKNPTNNYKFNKKITKEKKKKQTCKASKKKDQIGNQKSSQTLSTGLQSSQQGQLCTPVK